MRASHPSANWKLTLAYDGTDFQGWQVQPGLATIQGELRSAIARVTGEEVLPQGSGRTDAGVHALGQVASCALRAPIPPENFARALNRVLPAAIRVIAAEHAPAEFHARHSALRKTYEYRIHRGELCPPFLARYRQTCKWPLAFEPMQQAAQLVRGEHDFTSFAANDPDAAQREQDREPRHNRRTIFQSAWTTPAPDLLVYTVQGSGFLHHMVRNLVGTFLDVGRGQLEPEQIAAILAAKSRAAAGATAPARGLFLVSVDYPEDAGRNANLKSQPWQEP